MVLRRPLWKPFRLEAKGSQEGIIWFYAQNKTSRLEENVSTVLSFEGGADQIQTNVIFFCPTIHLPKIMTQRLLINYESSVYTLSLFLTSSYNLK